MSGGIICIVSCPIMNAHRARQTKINRRLMMTQAEAFVRLQLDLASTYRLFAHKDPKHGKQNLKAARKHAKRARAAAKTGELCVR